MQSELNLLRLMGRVSQDDWGQKLPDPLVPVSAHRYRLANLRALNNVFKLAQCSSKRIFFCLLKVVDDNSRILRLVEKENVPGLHRLLATHC